MQRVAELNRARSAGTTGSFLRRLPRLSASLSLRTQVVAASVLLAVIISGTLVLLLLAVTDLQRATTAQGRTKDVTAATLGLERVVNQLEQSLRAYVLSNNDRVLGSWRQAERNLDPAIGDVQKLVAGQPAEEAAVDRLSSEVQAFVSEYGTPLISIARISPNVARSGVATEDGLRRIKAIRTNLTRLLAREDASASERAGAAKREATRAEGIVAAALIAIAAWLILFGLFLARSIARPVRTVADGASRIAGGDFSTRLPEEGPAEIQQLTTAFNEMARSIEHGQRELESQNEQLRQSERLKSELVSIVSHELRTPLSSILGYSSLLLKRDFPREEARRYLGIIQSQGNRLASLIEDFLDVERVEAGRIALKDELIDLKPILVEEARLMSNETPNHRIEVGAGVPSLPVKGDRDRLAQVCGNLLANAVKYSPDGGLVDVAGEIIGNTVRVRVRDEGIGIPDEHQSRIFTKFFRGEARERGFVGTGLGLAVSREIIEAHGGRVGFTSLPGAGSTFWFELPLADGQGPG